MEEPGVFEILNGLLDVTITNVPTFEWCKMATIHKFLEKPDVSQFFIRFILCKLENNLKNYIEPYISLHAILILETLTNKYRLILQELSTSDLLDALIDSAKFSIYENIRRKILSLFRNWSYGRRKIRFGPIKVKLEKEGFKFSPEELLEDKPVPEGCCYKCEKRRSRIICVSCVQLFCPECSQKTVALPQFGFEKPVNVCDACYNNYQKPDEHVSYSLIPIMNLDHIVIKTIECPICLDILKKPIIQCKLGHSMCRACAVGNITSCPVCREEITQTRNYVVEVLIENQRTNCIFTAKGCRKTVNLWEKESHESGCEFRPVLCEGKKFCKWQCNWIGLSQEIGQHFGEYHKKTVSMQPKIKTLLKNNYKRNQDCYYIQFVNYCDGEKFFWYKQKIDVIKQKVYWTVQLIGTREEAAKYCYEIAIFHGPVRKFKVTEICNDDTADAEEIFESGKCVVVPVETLKTYINENNDFFCTVSIGTIVDN